MTKGKLYAQAQNFRTQKVLTAAKFANKDVDVVTSAPPADKFPFGVVSFCYSKFFTLNFSGL